MEVLKGVLGFKGERGYSAYEVAVQNGFEGTEQDWLGTLGSSSHFTKEDVVYTTTEANQTVFTLPNSYKPDDSFLDVYVNGLKISESQEIIDYTNKTVTLTNPITDIGTKVEMVVFSCATNDLPIVETINSQATNNTVAGTKSVYDFVTSKGYFGGSETWEEV